jgi:aminomethyltransferase
MNKRTFLYDEHLKLNAKITEFSGWDMPVQYTSIIDEHTTVRTACGMFDTSHMGTFVISGEGSGEFLNKVTVGDMANLPEKKARYSMFLNALGGVKDDIIVYKLDGKYLIVVNAGNLEKDFSWLGENKPDDVTIENISPQICLISVQGPKTLELLGLMSVNDLSAMKYFSCDNLELKNIKADYLQIARTGYTGEDGFEIFISQAQAKGLWKSLLALGVKPCGLGARDTLRLEACMPLYGHELSETINPIEAGLERSIFWHNDFIGKNTLLALKDNPKRKLVVFECTGGVARAENEVFSNGTKIGYVTSGTFSPTFKKAIGLALVDSAFTGEEFDVSVHSNMRKAKVVQKPFYKRTKTL